jgi:DNA-binding CsgD family transcriptional regulator
MSAVPAPDETHELAGREPELALTRSFLQTAAERGDYLLLCGDPGVGKSAILDAAADAAGKKTLVLRCNGVQYESDINFSGLNQLLLPLRDDVSRLDAELAIPLAVAVGFEDGPRPDREVVAAATLAVLRAVAEVSPVVVIVDDLHWCDSASTAVLEFLMHHLRDTRIGVLVTYRLGVDFALDRGRFAAHEVQPLRDTESSALVFAHFPALSAPSRQRLIREARGNPLALRELPVALSADRFDAAVTRPGILPLTPRLSMLYSSTVRALSPTARNLLLLAALDGSGELPLLKVAAPDCDVVTELNAAVNCRLITVDLTLRRITFQHPVIRSVVVEMSTGAERRAAHCALADALTEHPERRVWHLADATPEPDDAIATQLDHAAHRLRRRGDPGGAAALLIRSADLSTAIAERSRRIALAAYLQAYATGDLPQAARTLARAGTPETGSPASLQAAITSAFVALHRDGNIDFAHRLLTGTITDVLERRARLPDTVVEALQNLLVMCWYGARSDLWTSFFDIADRSGLDRAPLLRLAAQSMSDPARTTAEVLHELDEAIDALESEHDSTRIERVAAAALYVDRVRHCRAALMRMVERGRTGGEVTATINALMLVCLDDVRTGRWDDADALIAEGIALCEAHGFRLLCCQMQLAKALLSAARGEHSAAQHGTSAVLRWASHTGADSLRNLAHQALAISALGRGDYTEAYSQACAISEPGVLAHNVGHALWAALDLVEAAVRTHRHAQAKAHVSALRDAGVAQVSPRLALVVAASVAMVAPDSDFGPLFDQALALPGAADWPFERARIELIYGERLRRNRAISEARRHLGMARHIFARLGAAQFAARATAELAAAGVKAERGEDATAAILTPQEHQVALLAASGMTNKQIADRLGVTHRTVGAHLEQVFPKLAINSRSGLRKALLRSGSTPLPEFR